MVGVNVTQFKNPPILDVWRAQECKCFLCGKRLKGDAISRDHLRPRSSGRTLHLNAVATHYKCNAIKGSRRPTTEELERAREIYVRLGYPGWAIG